MAVAAVYWLDLVGVRDRSVVAALAAVGAWILSRLWLSWRARVRTDPDGVEVVDERGAVRVPWEEIEGFRVVGSEREVAQVVADRIGAEPLRLRPIEVTAGRRARAAGPPSATSPRSTRSSRAGRRGPPMDESVLRARSSN